MFGFALWILGWAGFVQTAHGQAKKPTGAGTTTRPPATTTNTRPQQTTTTPNRTNPTTGGATTATTGNRPTGGGTTRRNNAGANNNAGGNTVASRSLNVYASEACFVRVNNGQEIEFKTGETRTISVPRINNQLQIRTTTPAMTWTQNANNVAANGSSEIRLDFGPYFNEQLRLKEVERLQTNSSLLREQARADSLRRATPSVPQNNNTPVPQLPAANTQPAGNPSGNNANTTSTPPANNTASNTNTAPAPVVTPPTPEVQPVFVRPPQNAMAGQLWENSVRMKFVWIPAGVFEMGGGTAADTRPHIVDLTKGFWMGKYEVTQAQWEDVMGSNPSLNKGADLPVENVSYAEAQEFIRHLNTRESNANYRMPSEAEWEYAARAGSDRRFTWGNDVGKNRANCSDCGKTAPAGTTPIGTYFPNTWGLYDVHGNVAEWTADWYAENYYQRDLAKKDPKGPNTGTTRVVRGGAYNMAASEMRLFVRGALPAGFKSENVGFRVALSVGE